MLATHRARVARRVEIYHWCRFARLGVPATLPRMPNGDSRVFRLSVRYPHALARGRRFVPGCCGLLLHIRGRGVDCLQY